MKILTAAEMAHCDRVTNEEFGVSQQALMAAAGTAVARFALHQFPAAQRILVLCGPGNNGGDGLVAARELARAGRQVHAVLLAEAATLRPEIALLWSELLKTANTHAIECTDEAACWAVSERLCEAELIVDAMVGTGFRPPLRGIVRAVVEHLCATQTPILAVDLPSGQHPDAPTRSVAFRADAIVTFTAPKPAHVFAAMTRRWSDPVVVAAIGSPDAAVLSNSRLHWTGSAKVLLEAERAVDAHKGSFGQVLVVGGSAGKAGAAAMAAIAAMRSGAGLVTAAVPSGVLDLVASFAPEIMTAPLELEAESLLRRKTVLAIGPGMGTDASARAVLHRLLDASSVPVVLDADALNMLGAAPEIIRQSTRKRPTILTPHPGEMARLTKLTIAEIEADRIGVARWYAVSHGVTLVLKGWRTLVAHPDGRVAVNTTGNPGMAKGGSGDVLTGVIAGLLAQVPYLAQSPDRVAEAVEAAVCLHGLAGDVAACRLGTRAMLATDTIAALSAAFQMQLADSDGFIWLQGAASHSAKNRAELAS